MRARRDESVRTVDRMEWRHMVEKVRGEVGRGPEASFDESRKGFDAGGVNPVAGLRGRCLGCDLQRGEYAVA